MENQALPTPPFEATDLLSLELPLVLQTSRGAGVWAAVLLCGALGALGVWLYRDDGAWPALACAILFIGLAVLGGLSALFPATLHIDETGLRISSALRRGGQVTMPWQDFESFGVVNIAHRSCVAYQVSKTSGKRRIPGGYMLPRTQGIPAEVLASLLEASREFFTNESDDD
jgi:hypothetical protein